MAEGAKEEELEYESDPEESKLSLKMRRREASDDEEEEEGRDREDRGRRDKPKPPRRMVDSDGESDGQGAAAEYDDEVEDDEEYVEDDEEIIEEDEEEEYGEEEEYEERSREVGEVGAVKEEEVEAEEGKGRAEERVGAVSTEGRQRLDGDRNDDLNINDNQQGEQEEEKKENEPYAVPTAGAFYMHDDRFRDNAGGRHRRTFGGRKLWESRDDTKWGHDKFEELTMQERHYEEGRRTSRGRYRGRGRNRGPERGYGRGNRPRTFNTSNNSNKNNTQSNARKSVRGRGPRRYEPSFKKNNGAPPTQTQQSGKTAGRPSHSSSAKNSAPASNVESEAVPAKKHVFASCLNSASPPFYPSGSSVKEIPLTQKRDVQSGMTNQNVQPSVGDESFSIAQAQSSAMQRGKNVVDSMGMDKLYIDGTISAVAGKPSTNLQLPSSGSSSMSSKQSLQLRAQGRGTNRLAQRSYQPSGSNSLVNRISPPAQLHNAQRNPGQSRGQSSVQASVQHFAQNPVSESQISSPPKASLNKSSFESGEVESPSEASKSKTALIMKAKGSVQGSGRGSFLYGGTQVIRPLGNLGSGHGDQNFPAFLPVMQFGGQHPGGIGVPAVGMAFPGYVAQPQHGLGNSEMTWLPVLAGAAGALGATYCPPYISVDGAYHARSSGQPSSLPPASVKENTANNPNNECKPSQRPEVANDDFGQRHKNPRRYTEMKFDQ